MCKNIPKPFCFNILGLEVESRMRCRQSKEFQQMLYIYTKNKRDSMPNSWTQRMAVRLLWSEFNYSGLNLSRPEKVRRLVVALRRSNVHEYVGWHSAKLTMYCILGFKSIRYFLRHSTWAGPVSNNPTTGGHLLQVETVVRLVKR